MNILMLMWRDIANPTSGGAGRTTHELCKRWAKQGHKVTIFTSAFPNAREREIVEGYEVVRRGSLLTHYFFARQYYDKLFRGNYDVVIDQINTIPYFTPWYVRDAAIVVYIHQLCREIWFYETILPISLVGYLAEPLALRLYKHYPVITVSESTKQDLRGLGFADISIIPNAIDFVPHDAPATKANLPTIIFVGRLKKAKRPHHVLKALAMVKQEIPNVQLWVVGDGDFKDNLLRLAIKYRVHESVTFFGWLSLNEKRELMQKAHCICVPSVREGWGLIVTEANAVGTPAIAYNVPGLRDSVVNGLNGFLTSDNTPRALANTLLQFFRDKDKMKGLSVSALENSRKFDWDESASRFLKILEEKSQR